MTSLRRHFASDNYAGICPEAWDALQRANADHAPAYGEDACTARASDLLRQLFETDCELFFVFNGTAANSLALASLCQSYHSVICHSLAHVEADECGAPEFFSNGTKILLAPGDHAKLAPAAVEHLVRRRTDIHYPKPRVLSLTQATELGTLYAPAEISALCDTAHRLGLSVHMDGARLANALATLGCAPKEVTWKAGVDVLCFGGSKNGLAIGEAVIFFRKELAHEFEWRCKQAGQLASKMRFIAAPWVGLLETGAWLKNAQRANAAAHLLEQELRKLPRVSILHPVQANSVFAQFPPGVAETLREIGWRFYDFIGSGGARLMCAFDTTDADVLAFTADLRRSLPAR